jgi:hypothetical protein
LIPYIFPRTGKIHRDGAHLRAGYRGNLLQFIPFDVAHPDDGLLQNRQTFNDSPDKRDGIPAFDFRIGRFMIRFPGQIVDIRNSPLRPQTVDADVPDGLHGERSRIGHRIQLPADIPQAKQGLLRRIFGILFLLHQFQSYREKRLPERYDICLESFQSHIYPDDVAKEKI